MRPWPIMRWRRAIQSRRSLMKSDGIQDTNFDRESIAPTEKMTDEISEENLSTGRTRRSAAVASSKAWHTLMPHKKGMLSDNEDSDFQDSEKAEFLRKKRKQLKNDDAEQPALVTKKRGRSAKVKAEFFDSVDLFERNEEVTTQSSQSQEASKRSLSKKTSEDQKSPELPPSIDAATEEKSNKSSSAATTSPLQQQKQQQENRPSAVAAPPFVKHGPSIMQRSLKQQQPSAQQKSNDSGLVMRSPPPQLIKPGYGALNKEQLEEIDREVMKHQFDGFEDDGDEDEEEEEDPDGSRNIVLDDPDDQDYSEVPSRRSKRAGSSAKKTPREPKTQRIANASQRGQSKRGRPPSVGAPRAGARSGPTMPNLSGKPVLFNQHHIGGGRPMMINGAPFQHYNYPPGVPTSAFMSMRRPPPASDIDGGGMLLGGGGPDGRTVKVLRIRQPGSPAGPYGGGPPSSISGCFGGSSVSSRPSYMSSTVSGLSKEISEIAERYRNRVVPGTTVHEFSSIVDQVTFELNRVVEDRARLIANHREYLEQLNASHVAQLEFKDKRIQQLENTVETLQSKLLVSFKRNQLNVLKHETGDAPPATQSSSAGQHFGGSAVISSGGASTSSSTGALNGSGATTKREVTEGAGSLSHLKQPAHQPLPGSQKQQSVAAEKRRQVAEEKVVEETLEEIEEEVVPHDFEGLEDDEMLDEEEEEMLEEEVTAMDGEDDDDQYTLDYRSPNPNQILL